MVIEQIPWTEVIAAGMSLIAVNYSVKLGKALPVLKQLVDLLTTHLETTKDGKVTMQEKARVYDEAVDLAKVSYAYLKGITPWKSKV